MAYEDLARAIVLQAANDYRTAKRTLQRSTAIGLKAQSERARAAAKLKEVTRFFGSSWGSLLCSCHNELIFEKLQAEDYGGKRIGYRSLKGKGRE